MKLRQPLPHPAPALPQDPAVLSAGGGRQSWELAWAVVAADTKTRSRGTSDVINIQTALGRKMFPHPCDSGCGGSRIQQG